MQLAPIILFTYNRPEHTRITLEYLAKDNLADQSLLFVFCDGPKADASPRTIEKIQEVKQIIRSQQWTKEVHVEEAKENKGLATNVIEGVTKIVNKYGKAIILEDDLLISKGFLSYMNRALERYAEDDIVKQISGFLFPIEQEKKNTSFFLPVANTVGWGTWKRAWNEIDLQTTGYERLKTDKAFRHRFNLDGTYNYTRMLINQVEKGNNDSWAILYWWSIFTKKGITLFPDYSLIQHNDFDSSGAHGSNYDHYNHLDWQSEYEITSFPEEIAVDQAVFTKLKKYIKRYNRITMKKIFIKAKLFATNLLKN